MKTKSHPAVREYAQAKNLQPIESFGGINEGDKVTVDIVAENPKGKLPVLSSHPFDVAAMYSDGKGEAIVELMEREETNLDFGEENGAAVMHSENIDEGDYSFIYIRSNGSIYRFKVNGYAYDRKGGFKIPLDRPEFKDGLAVLPH